MLRQKAWPGVGPRGAMGRIRAVAPASTGASVVATAATQSIEPTVKEVGTATDFSSVSPRELIEHEQWPLGQHSVAPQQEYTDAECSVPAGAPRPHNCWAGEPRVARISARIETRLAKRMRVEILLWV